VCATRSEDRGFESPTGYKALGIFTLQNYCFGDFTCIVIVMVEEEQKDKIIWPQKYILKK
jgi:hypothetical protein